MTNISKRINNIEWATYDVFRREIYSLMRENGINPLKVIKSLRLKELKDSFRRKLVGFKRELNFYKWIKTEYPNCMIVPFVEFSPVHAPDFLVDLRGDGKGKEAFQIPIYHDPINYKYLTPTPRRRCFVEVKPLQFRFKDIEELIDLFDPLVIATPCNKQETNWKLSTYVKSRKKYLRSEVEIAFFNEID